MFADEPPIMDLCADDGDPVRYDPAFLLSILSCFLAPENRFNSLIILRSNIVPFLLRCLSSHCSNIRHLAAHCLLLCEGHFKGESSLDYTRDITPMRVTSGGLHLRGLAPGQHSSEEMSQREQAVSGTVRFDRPGNRTAHLPHRLRCAKRLS